MSSALEQLLEQGDELLAQRYLLLRPLGAGAQTRTYLAEDTLRRCQVVIKEVIRSEEEPLLRELRALYRLHHPNLVELIDLLFYQGKPLLVELYAEGPDFCTWSAQDRSPRRVCQGIAGALRGLRCLHALGIIHRDIKPDSLRVGSGSIGDLPSVRIVDFGLAASDPPPEVAGTLEYAAPEALAGAAVTCSADLYSLGVVLYEALFGHRPGLAPGALASSPQISPVPGCPALGELLADLLHPDPAKRPDHQRIFDALHAIVGQRLEPKLHELQGAYSPAPPLIGREHALTFLEGRLQAVRTGATVLVHLDGQGKTRVARYACLVGRLLGLEVIAPGNAAELVTLLADPPLSSELSLEALASGLAAGALERRSAAGLLLCFDGWTADEPLFGALLGKLLGSLLLRQIKGCLLLCSGELPAGLSQHFERLELEPLTGQEVRHAAAVMLQLAHDPPWLDQLATTTAGDPRLLEAIIRTQVDAGLPRELEPAPALEQLLTKQITSLSLEEQRLLAIISLAGAPLPLSMLPAIASEPAAPATAAPVSSSLQRLLAERMVTASGEELSPASPLFARLTASLVDAHEVRLLHHKLAQAWTARPGADPCLIGHHQLLAGSLSEGARLLLEAPIPAIADLRILAAELPATAPLRPVALERLALLERARGNADRALELASDLERTHRERGALLHAELSLDLGKPAEALRRLQGMRRGAKDELAPGVRSSYALLSARASFLCGDYHAAHGLAEDGLALTSNPALRLKLHNLAALSLLYTDRAEEANDLLDQALPGARRSKDLDALGRLLNSKGITLQRLGRSEQAATAYSECLDLARLSGDLKFAATSALNLGTLAVKRGEIGEALERFAVAATLAQRGNLLATTAWAEANAGNLLLTIGVLTAAEGHLQRALQLAEEETLPAVAGHSLLYLGELALVRGELSQVDSFLQRARTHFAGRDAAGLVAADLLAAEHLLGQERAAEAIVLSRAILRQLSADDAERWRAHLLLGRALSLSGGLAAEEATRQLEIALAQSRGHSTGRRWQIHGELARCYQGLDKTTEAAFHGELARLEIEQLRHAIPAEHRHHFDEMPRVKAVLEVTAASPAMTSSTIPSASALLHLLEINKELNQRLPNDQLLSRILELAIELTGAERGFVLLGRAQEKLRVAASRNIDQQAVLHKMQKFSRTIARLTIEEGQPIVAANAMDDDLLGQQLSVHGLRLRSVLCVPLRIRGEICGALYVDNRFRPAAFDHPHIELMQAFADQAGIALETARLLEDAARHRELLADAKAALEEKGRQLEALVDHQAQELSVLSVRLRSQEEELVRRYNAARIIGRSKAMRELFLQIDRLADADLQVFIWGESGTGKELVARAIHFQSARRDKPFVTINCGAIPANLLESELFGHVRGAFTGALKDRPGLFEVAGKGTLFLDEVGDMPPEMQVKLLRVLQEGTFRRLGEERERTSGCRVVSASLHNLQDLVAQGRFREDLYYRLNVVQLSVPPLRDRREDIPLIAEHIIKATGKQVALSPAALSAFLDFPWPGNVRQLENELQRASLMGGDTIGFDDLSLEIRRSDRRSVAISAAQSARTLQHQLKEHERQIIIAALATTGQRINEAAELLGIHRVALHRKMRALGIKGPRSK